MSPRVLGAALVLTLGSPGWAAEVDVKNSNVAGRGFNDGTAATPVGLNFGTTRGDQALLVFQTAAAIWGATLDSAVPVLVDSAFLGSVDDPRFLCNATSVVLGYAAATSYHSDPSFPDAALSYPAALANALSQKDLTPGASHITARFNADLGTSRCPFPLAWYFGLDTSTPAKSDNLLTVVLHEFGHGFGYATQVDVSTGTPVDGRFSAFDARVYTPSSGADFTSVSDAERQALITTAGGLAFLGPAVTSGIPRFLKPAPRFMVSAADWPAAQLDTVPGAFSAPTFTAQGQVVTADPLDACSTLNNAAALNGKVALIKRSDPASGSPCSFLDKATRAEAAGAIMVVIYDYKTEALLAMSGTGTLSIPALFVGSSDGERLASSAAREAVTLGFVLTPTPSNTDASGQGVLLYTPSTVQRGSSLSHWNEASFPATLLMEPAIEPDMRLNLDLTPAALSDLGWPVAHGLTVGLVKALGPYVALGGENRYVIAVFNHRATDLPSATLELSLPAGSTVVSSAGACTGTFPCTLTSLAAGELRLVVATVKSSADAASPFVALATLNPSTPDAKDRLTASTSATVATGGDLSVTVTGPTSSMGSNQTAGFTMTVTNNGPGIATGVTLKGSVTATDGTSITLVNKNDCATDFPCSLGDVPSGGSRSILSAFTTPDNFKAGLTFTAALSSSTADSNPANDTFTFTVPKPACGCAVDGSSSALNWGLLGLGLVLWGRRRRA